MPLCEACGGIVHEHDAYRATTASFIDIDPFDETPFSESFSGLINPTNIEEGCISDDRKDFRDISYNVERITDVKRFFDSDWSDADIDEILVMSSKPSHRLPTIMEDMLESESSPTLSLSLSSFDIVSEHGVDMRLGTSSWMHRRMGQIYAIRRVHACGHFDCSMEYNALALIRRLGIPSIWRMQWHFLQEDSLYMVLDHLTVSLSDYIHDRGALSDDHILSFATEIAEALHALHTAGIIHNNLNSENVMVNNNGRPIITDFRCARTNNITNNPTFCHDRLEQDIMSTVPQGLDYRAPEVILRWANDSTVDCWSFGGLLYLMVFGVHPSFGGSRTPDSIMRETVSFPVPVVRESAVYDLILKCMERNPAMRLNIQDIWKHEYFASSNRKIFNDTSHHYPNTSPSSSPISIASRKSTLDDVSSLFSQEARSNVQSLLPQIFRTTPDAESEARDRMALFWESLDREINEEVEESTPRARKLRKRRSVLFPNPRSFSIIPDLKLRSNASASTPNLLPTPYIPPLPPQLLDLPTGIEQIGSGIGFNLPSPRVLRQCHGFPSTGLGFGLTEMKTTILKTIKPSSDLKRLKKLNTSSASAFNSPFSDDMEEELRTPADLGMPVTSLGKDEGMGSSTLRLVPVPEDAGYGQMLLDYDTEYARSRKVS